MKRVLKITTTSLMQTLPPPSTTPSYPPLDLPNLLFKNIVYLKFLFKVTTCLTPLESNNKLFLTKWRTETNDFFWQNFVSRALKKQKEKLKEKKFVVNVPRGFFWGKKAHVTIFLEKAIACHQYVAGFLNFSTFLSNL